MRILRIPAAFLLLTAFVVGCSDQPVPTGLSDAPAAAAASGDAPSVAPVLNMGRGMVVHSASMGGADVCEAMGLPTGCDANFSLAANLYADGSVSGQYHDQFSGGVGFHAAIDCLIVVGSQAVVSGVITSGFAAGGDLITSVVDNGTSANDAADQLSFSFINTGITCDAIDPAVFPLFDLTNGQVMVF